MVGDDNQERNRIVIGDVNVLSKLLLELRALVPEEYRGEEEEEEMEAADILMEAIEYVIKLKKEAKHVHVGSSCQMAPGGNGVAKPVILAPKNQNIHQPAQVASGQVTGPAIFQSLVNVGNRNINIIDKSKGTIVVNGRGNVFNGSVLGNRRKNQERLGPARPAPAFLVAKPATDAQSGVTPITSLLKPTSVIKKSPSGGQSLLKVQLAPPPNRSTSTSPVTPTLSAVKTEPSVAPSSSSSKHDFSFKRIFVKKKRAFTVSGPRILSMNSLTTASCASSPPWENKDHGLVCPPGCQCPLGQDTTELPQDYLQAMLSYLRENFAVLALKNEANGAHPHLCHETIDAFLRCLARTLERQELFVFLRLCSKEHASARYNKCVLLNEKRTSNDPLCSSYFKNEETGRRHSVHQMLFKLFRGHRALNDNSLDIVSFKNCVNSGLRSDLRSYCINPWHFERAEGLKARECRECTDLRLGVSFRGPSCECFQCRKTIWTLNNGTRSEYYCDESIDDDQDDEDLDDPLPVEEDKKKKSVLANPETLEALDRDFDELLGSFETEILQEDVIKKEPVAEGEGRTLKIIKLPQREESDECDSEADAEANAAKRRKVREPEIIIIKDEPHD